MAIVKLSISLVLLLACVGGTQRIVSNNVYPYAQRYRIASLGSVIGTSSTFNIYTEKPIRVVDTRYKRSDVESALDGNIKIASVYLQRNHAISPSSVRITDAYTDQASGITHVYAKQVVGGIGIANGLANVNIDRHGNVISSSQSFVPEPVQAGTNTLDFWTKSENGNRTEQVKAAFGSLANCTSLDVDAQGIMSSEISFVDGFETTTGDSGFFVHGLSADMALGGQSSVSKEWLHLDRRVVPVWHICMQQSKHWWSAYVGADTDNQVHALCDWTYNYDAYNVLPRNIVSPDNGSPQLVVDPANPSTSPHGWVTGNTTTGNNVWAQTNPSGKGTLVDNLRPVAKGMPNKVFDFPFNTAQEPDKYADFAVTQLFYTVNVMHDLSFVYGFDEAAGNFQDINFSGKGVGGDHVVAFAQDGSDVNNAMFTSPPDGQSGTMKMYLWTATTPKRDGDLEQDIVAHEFTHGISNRLTGGPSNADCLAGGEPGGMGEGWSDIVANILRIRQGMTREHNMEMGRYVNGKNIRMYPYSTSMATNPQTFKYLDKAEYKEVHSIGEVWATMLYEVLWNIIDESGISDDLFKHDIEKGNSIMLQILLDGMKLQPCNPLFIDAREAIIQAEHNLTGGKYKCAIWRGFSKRGLGVGASANKTAHTEDFGVPPECGEH
ncbi:hypothetical protein IW140_000626 [Coemansia sp. RSA 1813]|nr:hypothetical protein LPJ74_000194 [Coemansia sp. RSA 1843]KAJ2092514.1 hypothetical protein IW138_000952 [Coemansia sp. RSA 986]KAJ2216791.1 hypothetical protein EV179_001081 [Coemansia sp. RSA 487]KAJ2572863.1 hypothetical protein IW140_000626 [Coemansia sp. RSA 1813]